MHIVLVLALLVLQATLAAMSMQKKSCTLDETLHIGSGLRHLYWGDGNTTIGEPTFPRFVAALAVAVQGVDVELPSPTEPASTYTDLWDFGTRILLEQRPTSHFGRSPLRNCCLDARTESCNLRVCPRLAGIEGSTIFAGLVCHESKSSGTWKPGYHRHISHFGFRGQYVGILATSAATELGQPADEYRVYGYLDLQQDHLSSRGAHIAPHRTCNPVLWKIPCSEALEV
jgi:hypothetical protein